MKNASDLAASVTSSGGERLRIVFAGLADPQTGTAQRHRRVETCLIALAATLCGAESCVDAPRSHCCGGLPRGLVNSREHLESLLVAKETGYASLQQYLGVMADDPERRADAVATAEAR